MGPYGSPPLIRGAAEIILHIFKEYHTNNNCAKL